MVQWKGVIPAGQVCDHPVIQLDVLPTALAAAGVQIDPAWNLDGVNLLPYLTGEKKGPPHAALYWRLGKRMAIRVGDWKLAKGGDRGAPYEEPGKATTEGAELYNLATDIGEKKNLADKEPEKVRQLAKAWNQWSGELAEPKWLPVRGSAKKAADVKDRQPQKQQQDAGKQPRKTNAPQPPAQPPTYADVKYGPYDRNVMDIWLAKSDQPTPVLVSIHGGGFSSGNKSIGPGLLRECLKSGISVVAITYRLSDEAKAPAQFLDAARAIQFVRSKAKPWNLDPTRIAATGASAGAGISLWLGFHDDLADPSNPDPVLRQSTRLICMAVYNGQTSYDPRFIRDLLPGTDTYKSVALAKLFDMDPNNLDNLPQEKYRLFEEVSALPHLTKDDAPALLVYGSTMDTPITSHNIGIHHPRFGKSLKEKMDALGVECQIATGIKRDSEEHTALTMDFITRHFGTTATAQSENGSQKTTKTPISADQVPDAVKQAFQIKFLTVELVEWNLKSDKTYEAEFTVKGTEITVLFDPTGKWLETESAIDPTKVPKVVNNAAAEQFKGYKVIETQSVERWNAQSLIYELHFEDAKEIVKAQFSGQGAILNKSAKAKP
jgi:acetyl esterase